MLDWLPPLLASSLVILALNLALLGQRRREQRDRWDRWLLRELAHLGRPATRRARQVPLTPLTCTAQARSRAVGPLRRSRPRPLATYNGAMRRAAVVLILGFLFVDFVFFHDLLKPGEITTLPQYMTGLLSILVFAVCVQALRSPRR